MCATHSLIYQQREIVKNQNYSVIHYCINSFVKRFVNEKQRDNEANI